MMRAPMSNEPVRDARRGFTLTEILVAVAVLIAILLATSRIFSTTQQVTSAGEANAAVLAEAAAIEAQLRADIRALSYDGYFAVRCVALRNEQANGSLLNPALPRDAVLRSDQLLFFREGLEQPQVHRIGAREKIRPRGTVSRMLWTHGFMLGQVGPSGRPSGGGEWRAYDAPLLAENGDLITPWAAFQSAFGQPAPLYDPVCTQMEQFGGVSGSGMFEQTGSCIPIVPNGTGALPRFDARTWPLVRQAAVLLSDDAPGTPADAFTRTVYQSDSFGDIGGVNAARSIFLEDPHPDLIGEVLPELRNSRVDAAGLLLDEVHRRLIFRDPTNPEDVTDTNVRPWRDGGPESIDLDDRFSYLTNPVFGAMFYPRVEKVPPSSHRVDQALSSPIIGTAVSSIRIEWAWDEGTGEAVDENDVRYLGVSYRDNTVFDTTDPTQDWRIQPSLAGDRIWFGLPDDWDRPRVAPYGYGRRPDTGSGLTPIVRPPLNAGALLGGQPRWTQTGTIDWWNVEAFDPEALLEFQAGDVNQTEYVAAFGRNRSRPLDRGFAPSQPDPLLAYTPWPSAIRVTLTVHDPATSLELGREIQFTIELPNERDRSTATGVAGDVRQDAAFLSGASVILQTD